MTALVVLAVGLTVWGLVAVPLALLIGGAVAERDRHRPKPSQRPRAARRSDRRRDHAA